jgi:mRNA interferase MazF
VNRGDIHTVAGGSDHTGKPRRAVVFQDMNIESGAVIVIPLTSVYAHAPDLRVYLEPSATTGLIAPSWAAADKISAVRLAKIGPRIGQVGAVALARLERAVLVATGIAGRSNR